MTDDKKPRGFAAWPKERLREVASMGGKSADTTGRRHRWTSEEAKEAGRKGGRSTVDRGVGIHDRARSQATPPKVES